MSAVAPDREQQLVRGTVASIIAKGNDSFQIEVREEGSQYSRKLWTKNAALVQQIQQQGVGQAFDFMTNASYWRNQSGQQVRSLWLDDDQPIAAFGSLQAPAQPQPTSALPGLPMGGTQTGGLPTGPQPGFVGGGPAPGQVGPGYLPGYSVTPPVQAPAPQPQVLAQADGYQQVPPVIKDERIMRQTAMKCACIFVGYLPEDQRSVHGLEHLAEWFVRYFKGGPQMQEQSAQGPLPASFGDPQTEMSGAPDWVTNQGPVPSGYNAGAQAQQGYGSEDGGLQAQPPGAYTGGFPQ